MRPYFLIIKLSPFLSFMGCTYRARLYFFIRTSPIDRNGGKLFQHVFIAQEPDTPWHLQSVLRRFLTICWQTKTAKHEFWIVQSYSKFDEKLLKSNKGVWWFKAVVIQHAICEKSLQICMKTQTWRKRLKTAKLSFQTNLKPFFANRV